MVFVWTLPSRLKDDGGIELSSDPLRLNGGTMVAATDNLPAAWNLAAERNIGGMVRFPSVSAASDGSQVMEGHLAGLTTLEVTGLLTGHPTPPHPHPE